MKAVIAALAISAAVIMAIDVRKPYDRAVASTVWIEAGEGTGTGVFVGPDLILTAYHVIEGEPVITAHSPRYENGVVISDPAGYRHGMKCTVIASDPVKDLALLRVKGQGIPMKLAANDASPGDPLFAIGCGDGTSLFGYSTGYVRQLRHIEYPRVDGVFSGQVLDTSVSVNMGDSGGPLVDSGGNLAGVVSSIDVMKNETYLATTASEIRTFLARARK